MHLRGAGLHQVAHHGIVRWLIAAQALPAVKVAAHAAAALGDVDKQFQPRRWHAVEAAVRALETHIPDPAQGVRQTPHGGVRQFHRGLFRGHRLVVAGQFTVCV
ncbi:hypothetical protein D3C85_1342270 [compost metagenome]